MTCISVCFYGTENWSHQYVRTHLGVVRFLAFAFGDLNADSGFSRFGPGEADGYKIVLERCMNVMYA